MYHIAIDNVHLCPGTRSSVYQLVIPSPLVYMESLSHS